MMEAFLVRSPGPWTTVQDRGRFGYRHMGVPVSGALDSFAFRVANWLIGNTADCAVLEMTFMGVHLEVLCEADIAVTGADMALKMNSVAGAGWRSVRVRPGDLIQVGAARSGCRSYLAVTGGIDVPLFMRSRSTYVTGKLGGVQGRPLKKEDVLKRGEGALLSAPRSFPWIPEYPAEILLRAIPGTQADCFEKTMEVFFRSKFTVTAQSDRMGYRLRGPELTRDDGTPKSIISEPTMPGNVQVPPNGQPVILLVEQTLGGYSKIATVISPDVAKVAQAKPGDIIQFVRVTLDEAHRLYREWVRYLAHVEELLGTPL